MSSTANAPLPLDEAALADFANARILLVADNVQNVELMHAYLESLHRERWC